MMRSYFYFHVSIEVLLILPRIIDITEEIRTPVTLCVSSGRPKSNKMLNKNKIFWPLQTLTNIE